MVDLPSFGTRDWVLCRCFVAARSCDIDQAVCIVFGRNSASLKIKVSNRAPYASFGWTGRTESLLRIAVVHFGPKFAASSLVQDVLQTYICYTRREQATRDVFLPDLDGW